MIARVVNQAADVIHRAQVNGAQTATGLAIALESARLLVSDEMVHEMAALEAQRDALLARVAELEAASQVDNEALDDAAEALRARPVVAVYEERSRAGSSGERTVYRMLAGDVADGEHYLAVHHDYRLGHDLPETGGAR